ncbi:MAG: bifunctional uridylyltransferase/uridylyl-removing protein GlnD [Polyangiaceae bacterium]
MSAPSDTLIRAAPPLGGELRVYLQRHRDTLAAGLDAPCGPPAPPGGSRTVTIGDDGQRLGVRHRKMLDGLMSALFAASSAAIGGASSLCLAAVGSYGRGAVALRSDADVRIIVPPRSKSRELATKFVEALLYPLWDAGLSIGHQVIDPDEVLSLAHEDLATATSLLDLRALAGERSLATSLVDRAYEGLFDGSELAAFIERLEEEATGRHARFGGSVYLLEPDVKSGAGGLRDLDGARWAARARFRVGEEISIGGPASVAGKSTPPEAMPLGFWGELVRLGVLVPREAQEMAAAEEFLWRVRNRLHAHADRRSDRLTFDEQEALAISMGYGGEGGDAPSGDRAAAAERFMQDYYLHARAVSRGRERILLRATPAKKRGKPVELDLGGGVRLFDGQVTIAGVQELSEDPALALRAYAACIRQSAPLLPFAREAIARAASDPAWCAALRASPEAGPLFTDLICTVAEGRTRRGSIAGELHDVGLLLAMIPEFAPVTGRVHHDVYHVYTVDVHSVAAVDALRALCRGEATQDRPLATRLATEIARPKPIFLATLLHDVGKGYPDASGSRKNHSQSGAELCDVILPRLGLSAEDTVEARHLVAQHLAMYHVATRRDLDDPATIEEFCRLVRGREGLRDLFLLTVVDLSTTSPTAMTSWKARMLDELYFAADAHLAGAKDRAFDEARLARVRDSARTAWVGPPEFLEAFLDSMPERYLLANGPDAIAAHAGVALDRGIAPVHAAIVPSRHPEVAEVCVVAEDKPGLLARIAAALTAGRLEVLAAQVYSRGVSDGAGKPRTEAVDLFWVRDRTDGPEGAERAMPRLIRDLNDVCSGALDPAELLRQRTGSASPWRERPSPAVLTEVVIDGRASPRHTVIEVFAKDRPGLLYTIASALHELGLSIALSKINTEGTKVADVFYVNELDPARSGADGMHKVQPGERSKQIREAIVRAIGE